ncbi:MAG: alpha/beta hydrolase domain-containing protein [Acidobacteriota bacterium]|nr:alpha/beta hydrolase domain-containing protein [Acidobacteriota bacterium]
MTRRPLRPTLLGLLSLAAATPSSAELTRMVIETRAPLPAPSAGEVTAYERLGGYAIGALDPADSRNAVIVDIDKAPRDGEGRVRYRVDVEIHRPIGDSNGTLLYDVVNRGNKVAWRFARRSERFTLVWTGWQGDLPNRGETLRATLPIATDSGQPIVGLSREEFIGKDTETPIVRRLQYPAATLDRSRASLTVRHNERDPRRRIDTWRYLGNNEVEITHPGPPYDAGAIFELIYPATEPIIAGIGFAAMRDVVSHLRFEKTDAAGNENPLTPGSVERAIAMGVSQSGRMLRDFLYLGFNQDEAGRRVFDGALPIIPGSRKIWANHRFAQPGRWSKQHEDHLQPGDQFPFAYPETTDPLTGRRDGILARCRASGTCPKIAHVDGEFEIWGARGSLLVTDGDPAGPRDLPTPADVRLYMVAGTPHGGAGLSVPRRETRGDCQNVLNPLGQGVVSRAILVALNAWITDGTAPPESRYGSAEKGTLVSPLEARFPNIPEVTYNGSFNSLRVTDYGEMPPREGAEYGVLVPRVDGDGNSLAGIRLPALEAPIATYTGWNLRRAGHAEGEGCGASGSYIAFAMTAADRDSNGDPRPAIAQRYRDADDYVARVEQAARRLVGQRLLLAEDATSIVAEARTVSGGWRLDRVSATE